MLAKRQVLPFETLEKALADHIPARHWERYGAVKPERTDLYCTDEDTPSTVAGKITGSVPSGP